jgi:hypothetical protein
MMTEDEILDAFGVLDDLETSRKLEACQRRVVVLEARLRERPAKIVMQESTSVKHWREQADKYERLYRACLARNEVLNRKVRDLNG